MAGPLPVAGPGYAAAMSMLLIVLIVTAVVGLVVVLAIAMIDR